MVATDDGGDQAGVKKFCGAETCRQYFGMAELQRSLGKNNLGKIQDWCRGHPGWALALLTVAALAPFLAKPFNIDDPLFIWVAQQIQAHPANPYGFEVNWVGYSQPMWAALQNPPLMSYYLAAAAGILGWSEAGLHLACMLPAVAAVLGTYRLARNFCRWPMFAAVATLFAPGFLVSGTTVMCDVTMLAFWVWAVVFWTEGMKQNNFYKLSVAGTLTALAVLAKYNGACLIPLLAAHGWLERRTIGRWAWFLLIPVAALGAYEWATFCLYGHPHLFASMQYAQGRQTVHGLSRLIKVLSTLTFTGGCFVLTVFCLPWVWRRRGVLLIAGSAAVFLALAAAAGMMSKDYHWLTDSHFVAVEFQVWWWTVGGISVLALALVEVREKRDADSCLLALWISGVFMFAAFIYWMVNARVILPLVPAVAILLARRLESNRLTLPAGVKFAVVVSAALSLLAAQADFQQASIARTGAARIGARYASAPGQLWFKGHFGFQYYLQSAGALPLDFEHLKLSSGDILAMQLKNTDEVQLAPQILRSQEAFSLPGFHGLGTMDLSIGAGFYSQLWGPLPFAFGANSPDQFFVYVLKKPEETPR